MTEQHEQEPKISLLEGNVLKLTPVINVMGDGLKQGPQPCPWGDDYELYGPDEWANYGVVDGWMWATDKATALIAKSETYLDLEHCEAMGRKVVELVAADQPAPLYAVAIHHLSVLGGQAIVPNLGRFDLSRLVDAAIWAAGPGTPDEVRAAKVLMCREDMAGGDLVRITGPHGRVAAVIGCAHSDLWCPTIEVPMEDVTDQMKARR